MTGAGIAQTVLFFLVLFALAIPLGSYMARVYEGKATTAQKMFGWLERLLYRMFGVDPKHEQTWQRYAVALLVFNVLGLLLVY
jgi:K+-transporting ATPase ATPase A chain